MRKRYITFILIGLCALWGNAQSLYNTDAASDFNKGHIMYLNGNYTGCLDIMQSLLQRDDASQYKEEAAFFVAMSQARRSSDRTEIVLNSYLQQYPFTIHRHEILLALGNYYFHTGNYAKALDCYLKLDIDNVNTSERKDLYYHIAFCHIKANNEGKALPLLKSLAQNSPKHRDEARYYEGYIYYKNNDYSNAARSLSMVQTSSDFGYEAQYLLANIDFLKNDYAQAIARSEQLLDDSPSPSHAAELNRILGESHYQLGNDTRADEHFTQYLHSAEKPSRNTLYMAGIIAYRNSNHSHAIELLSQAADTTDAIGQNAYLHLGLSYLQQQDITKATQAFEQAAYTHFDETTREIALYNQALCCYESNFSMFDSTITLFEKFLKQYPKSVYADDVNTRLSDLYINSRNYRKALDYIERIQKPSREILQQKQQVLYLIGTEEFANNSIGQAGERFSQAIKVGNYAPEYRARSIYWLGECCYRNKAYKEALKCYNQFLTIPITTEQDIIALAHYNAAYCHFEMQDYNEALTAFELFTQQPGISNPLLTDANNRIGDCYFNAKEYNIAYKYYEKAADMRLAGSDYAVLQQAVIQGVNKKNSKKVKLLKRLVTDYPQSEYGEEAYNEMGETYITMNKRKDAIKTYKKLMELYPEGASTRKAMLQLGSLYYNQKDIENSIETYQSLITQHPSSDEARIAAEDLKSIYIEINRINELSAFMQQYGVKYEKNELDSLSYLAAEHSYTKQNDISPLKEYVAQYPDGNYAADAYFHLGNVADAQQDENQALTYYQKSLESNPDSEYAESALTRCSSILYEKQDYAQAVKEYAHLEAIASTPDTRQSARMGIMRCYLQLQQYNEAAETANRLLNNSNLSPEIKQEVLYTRATAYTALQEYDKAYDDYAALAVDTRSIYGAESAFRVAEHLYHNNQTAKAEEAANAFIEKGTTHAYWLARNFILLSDIYTQQEDYFTAKQYLLQLKENYPGSNDDIATLIEERLQRIATQQEQAD